MLRLIGTSADGWLPSLGRVQPGDLAASNAMIDDAASQAGRSPSAVRRLLKISGSFTGGSDGLLDGPPAQWVEQLAELAVWQGFSTFILAGDHPDDLRRFAAEVAPAVRDRVALQRR